MKTWCAAAIGVAFGMASSADAAAPDARVIVRPLRVEELLARGVPPTVARSRADAAIRRVARDTHRTLDAIGCRVVRVPPGRSADELARSLEVTGDYAFVEVDRLVSVAALPNDPLYASQWHLAKIGAPVAWSVTTGDADLVVAVADSGIDLDHPDLAPLLVAGYNAVDDIAQVDGGLVDGLTDHGTEVAGCVAAATNNGIGIAGLCHGVRLMPIRVSNQPGDTAFLSDINAGAIWAADHGATVVNASFSNVLSPTVFATADYLLSKGVNYVWAAGNAASSLGSLDPANVTVVGATDSTDALAVFSNTGAAIDLVAPGVAIQTTKLGGLYAAPNGTSFASPIVAAALALVRSANPNLAPLAAEFVLRTTAKDLGPAGEDATFGAGRLNVAAAVQLAAQSTSSELAPFAVDDVAWGEPTGADIVIRPLANDVDLNGDAVALVSFDASSAPGSVRLGPPDPDGAPTVVFDPSDCFEGVASIPYVIADDGGLEDEGEITVGVARIPAFDGGTPYTVPGFGSPSRIEVADIDLDGDDDIVAVFISTIGTISIFRNDGGAFVHGGSLNVSSFGAVTVDVADMVGDSCPDLVVAESLANRLVVVPGQCGSFGTPLVLTMTQPSAIAVRAVDGTPFDPNGDGHTDLVVAQGGFPTVLSVLFGDGNGGFAPAGSLAVQPQPQRLAIADLTGDGSPEIVCLGSGSGELRVASVSTTGALATISTTTSSISPSDLALADLDGDGDLDVACASNGALGTLNGFLVHLNDGHGVLSAGIPFTSPSAWPNAIAVADFDGDADSDVVLPHLLSNEFGTYAAMSIPTGSAILPLPKAVPTLTGAQDCAALDADGDGDLDVAVAVISAGPRTIRVYRSEPPASPGADLDNDGTVGPTDLGLLLGAWGGPGADLNGSGTTGPDDLAILLGAWGGC
ncbi:MAG: S8 family serine peptidase [Phycisphaerae bacterium]|nr:S8 family serine peptidase [Phycisphaerae bacterium]